jgi:flagellar hook-associated protein 3 FlgL
MTTISTAGLDLSLLNAMRQARDGVTVAQQQLASGRKSETYSGLGLDAARSLSSRSVMARQSAYVGAANQAGQAIDRANAEVGGLRAAAETFRAAVRNAMAAGDASGLASEAEALMSKARQTLNSQVNGRYLFAGARSDAPPFAADTLADVAAAATPADLFTNDAIVPRARVAEGVDLPTSLPADTLATPLVEAMRAFAALGIGNGTIDNATITQLGEVATALDGAVDHLVDQEAELGRRSVRADDYKAEAQTRADIFRGIAGDAEDADLAEVVSRLTAAQTSLQASLQAMAQIGRLSLATML